MASAKKVFGTIAAILGVAWLIAANDDTPKRPTEAAEMMKKCLPQQAEMRRQIDARVASGVIRKTVPGEQRLEIWVDDAVFALADYDAKISLAIAAWCLAADTETGIGVGVVRGAQSGERLKQMIDGTLM